MNGDTCILDYHCSKTEELVGMSSNSVILVQRYIPNTVYHDLDCNFVREDIYQIRCSKGSYANCNKLNRSYLDKFCKFYKHLKKFHVHMFMSQSVFSYIYFYFQILLVLLILLFPQFAHCHDTDNTFQTYASWTNADGIGSTKRNNSFNGQKFCENLSLLWNSKPLDHISEESSELLFCNNYKIQSLIPDWASWIQAKQVNIANCSKIWKNILKADVNASRQYKHFVSVMTQYATPEDYSICWDELECKVNYKLWTCSQYHKFFDQNISNNTKEEISPCNDEFCFNVEKSCPFFRILNKTKLYGGQSTFLCTGFGGSGIKAEDCYRPSHSDIINTYIVQKKDCKRPGVSMYLNTANQVQSNTLTNTVLLTNCSMHGNATVCTHNSSQKICLYIYVNILCLFLYHVFHS